ncbi:hypothetical protein [Microbacterium oxydans]|uniref:hypothetical protein n=1 Tax=Microbacterium oxydans TaxID=82380 RepID=UPI0024AD7BE9|nr:hypothetical protein [Microbacterium oxydans]
MGEEAIALHDHRDRGRILGCGAVERDLDDRSEMRRAGEVFAHGQQSTGLHTQAAVGGTGRGESNGLASHAQTMNPLVFRVDEVERAVLVSRPRTPAVLVHT